MGWVRVQDNCYDHPKIAQVGPLAELLFLRSIQWSNRNLTDGHIPTAQLSRIGGDIGDARMLANKLIEANLWEQNGVGYVIHDYLQHQTAAKAVRSELLHQQDHQRLAGKARAAGAARASGRFVKAQATTSTTSRSPASTPAQKPAQTSRRIKNEELRTKDQDQKLFALSERFDREFWTEYPKRNGKRLGKAEALKVWLRLSDSDRELALAGVVHYAASGELAKDAERWLKHRCFVDWQEPAVVDSARTGRLPLRVKEYGIDGREIVP